MKRSGIEKILITMICDSICSSVAAGQEQPCLDYMGYSDWCDICKLKHQVKLSMELLETNPMDQKVWLVEGMEFNLYTDKLEPVLKRVCTVKPDVLPMQVVTEVPIDIDLKRLGCYPHEHGEEI